MINCSNDYGCSGIDGSADDCRSNCYKGDGCKDDSCRVRSIVGVLTVMSIRVTAVRMIITSVRGSNDDG